LILQLNNIALITIHTQKPCVMYLYIQKVLSSNCVTSPDSDKKTFRPDFHAPPLQSESSPRRVSKQIKTWSDQHTLKTQLLTWRKAGSVGTGMLYAGVVGEKTAGSKRPRLFSPNHLPHRRFSLANWSWQIFSHSADCCLKSNYLMR
jgi:hypothetical protein